MLAKRLAVVLSGIVILMCLGAAYSWGVFLLPIDQDLGWGRTKISIAVSILLLVFSLFMTIGGYMEEKFGPRITSSIGAILVGLGWFIASFSNSPIQLYLSYGVLTGIGTGLCYMSSLAAGIECFPHKKGFITGFIVFGFGFGTTLISPILVNVIEKFGWRTTMEFGGIVFGCIIIFASQFLKVVNVFETDSLKKKVHQSQNYTPLQMLKTKNFKIIFLSYFLAMIAGMMTIAHINAFALDINFGSMQAALALTVLSLSNGFGRILAGYFSDLLGRKKVLISLFITISISMFSLCHSLSLFTVYIFSGIIGFSFGGFLAVYPPLTADLFGRKDFPINYGLVFIGYGVGCFIGPLLGGFLHDLTENYFLAFNFAGSLSLIGGILVFFFLKTSTDDF